MRWQPEDRFEQVAYGLVLAVAVFLAAVTALAIAVGVSYGPS